MLCAVPRLWRCGLGQANVWYAMYIVVINYHTLTQVNTSMCKPAFKVPLRPRLLLIEYFNIILFVWHEMGVWQVPIAASRVLTLHLHGC